MSGVGDVLHGRYRLVRRLGAGAMGQVWLARDELLGRNVAVKQLLLDVAETLPEDVERATREARLASLLNHPGAVGVHDLVLADGRPTLVMEYVEGPTLSRIVREQGPLDVGRAADLMGQVAEALAAAHALDIVHRDVKPSNILVTADGRAKLADFGIARSSDDASLTSAGAMMGTIAYMAPEIAHGAVATRASDVWSLGAALFSVVEGRAVFQGATPAQVLAALVHQPVPVPQRAGPLAGVLREMLHKEPGRRPSAAVVAQRLVAISAGRGGSSDSTAASLPPPPPAQAPREPSLSPRPPAQPAYQQTPQRPHQPAHQPYRPPHAPPAQAPRRRTGLWVAVAAVTALVVVIGGVVAAVALRDRSPRAATVRGVTAPSGGGTGARVVDGTFCGRRLAFLGPVTGFSEKQGAAVLGGIRLAVDRHNAEKPDCTLSVVSYDSEGSADLAPAQAKRIAADDSVIGVVGPLYNIEIASAAPRLAASRVPAISPWGLGADPQELDWPGLHLLGPDALSGARAAAKYLVDGGRARSLFVVEDSELRGTQVATDLRARLGDAVVGSRGVQRGQDDLSAIAAAVVDADAGAVVVDALADETGRLIAALRAAGYDGTVAAVAGPTSVGSEILATAAAAGGGAAAGDVVLVSGVTPTPAGFTARGDYAVEAYDATRIFLDAVDAGVATREDLTSFIDRFSGTGQSGPISFEGGRRVASRSYVYRMSGGVFDLRDPTVIE